MDFPFTIAVLKCSIKPIRVKLSDKGLPANRGAKRAVSSNRPIDVRSIVGELSLANDRRALDGHGDLCRFTLLNGRFCRASPLPIEWTGAARGKYFTALREEQR